MPSGSDKECLKQNQCEFMRILLNIFLLQQGYVCINTSMLYNIYYLIDCLSTVADIWDSILTSGLAINSKIVRPMSLFLDFDSKIMPTFLSLRSRKTS